MKCYRLLLALLMPLPVVAGPQGWFCFKSIDTSKPIQLAFGFGEDDHSAYVRYQRGSGVIGLKTLSLDAQDLAEGRPSDFHYRYQEQLDGKTGGIYDVEVQGAVFGRFAYTAKNKKKTVEFERDPDAEAEQSGRCGWQKD